MADWYITDFLPGWRQLPRGRRLISIGNHLNLVVGYQLVRQFSGLSAKQVLANTQKITAVFWGYTAFRNARRPRRVKAKISVFHAVYPGKAINFSILPVKGKLFAFNNELHTIAG